MGSVLEPHHPHEAGLKLVICGYGNKDVLRHLVLPKASPDHCMHCKEGNQRPEPMGVSRWAALLAMCFAALLK